MSYLCTVFAAAMVESVDTKDLKSFGPKRLCGFKSHSRYQGLKKMPHACKFICSCAWHPFLYYIETSILLSAQWVLRLS